MVFVSIFAMGRWCFLYGRPPTTIIDENIEAVEQVVIHDRQISIRRVADELNITKSSVHQITNEHLGMKKVCTQWMLKSLTPLQRMNWVDCCEELLQESEVDSAEFFSRIVTGVESWVKRYDPLSQQEVSVWKVPGAPTPRRLPDQRSAGKIRMAFYQSILCRANSQSMVLIMHRSSSAYVLWSTRSAETKAAVECCFTTTLASINAVLHRLLFDGLVLSNWTIRPILQILRRLIMICSQTCSDLCKVKLSALMIKGSQMLRTTGMILIWIFL